MPRLDILHHESCRVVLPDPAELQLVFMMRCRSYGLPVMASLLAWASPTSKTRSYGAGLVVASRLLIFLPDDTVFPHVVVVRTM